jgi:hypothetical protein
VVRRIARRYGKRKEINGVDVTPLRDSLGTILYKADPRKTRFYRPTGTINDTALERIANAFLERAVEQSDPNNSLLPMSPEVWELTEEPVLLLMKLHETLDASHRAAFTQIVSSAFSYSSNWRKFSGYLFTFLARVHDFSAAVDAMLGNLLPYETGYAALGCLSNYVKYDNARLTDKELDQLSKKAALTKMTIGQPSFPAPGMASSPSTATLLALPSNAKPDTVTLKNCVDMLIRIHRQVSEVKYERLRNNLLQNVNLEINQDKDALKHELERFGFDKELVESLEFAESEYRKADSKFVFKTCADHNRCFFEMLLLKTAVKIAQLRSHTIPTRSDSAVSVRDYLKRAGFLSERFYKLCEAFYHFASDESAHNLSSAREVARIVRNLNIELGLLIMQRLSKTMNVSSGVPALQPGGQVTP